ncbi:MAG: histidinol dehydrogenase [Solirubrobacterales bacterium]
MDGGGCGAHASSASTATRGPSELLVIFDATTEATPLALDLLAQAEHGADSPLVAVSTDRDALQRLADAVGTARPDRPSAHDARLDLVAIDSGGSAAMVDLAQAYAPEHVEVACADAGALAAELTTAGCVFTGPAAAVAFGDYAAGSNHILPTGGAGRYTRDRRGPGTFRRRISRVSIDGVGADRSRRQSTRSPAPRASPVRGESALRHLGEDASGPAESAS